MPAKLQEITATFRRERLRFDGSPNDTIIGDVDLQQADKQMVPAAIKGQVAEGDDLEPRQDYRFYGRWTTYENKNSGTAEKQFQFRTFVKVAPHSRAGIIGYLEKAPGIGPARAAKLYEKFNSNAVKILRDEPDIAADIIRGLTLDTATSAAEWLKTEQAIEDCTIELIDLLDGRGFRKSLAKDVIKEWGNRAPQIIQQNPHRLMDFRGCGFKLADSLYLDLGKNPAALKRQALCGWYALASNTNGDTWHYCGVVEQGIKGSIGGAEVRFKDATRLATRGDLMGCMYTEGRSGPPAWDGDVMWLADARKARNEGRVAESVAKAMGEGSSWPDCCRLGSKGMSSRQGSVLSYTLRKPIAILGGSPGTGKTYAASLLIGALVKEFGENCICVCAPTGKAAVRITEAMASHGLPIVARTIHSTLGVESQESRGGWSFQHDASNPLPYRFIFVDESSMIDADLMASLLAARARGSYILFVGDVNQLPPVGHGAPLRDMIAAGVPYGELTEIKRNDGGIVQACANMRDGKAFKCEGNLRMISAGSPETQLENIQGIIGEDVRVDGLDPVWDCQVVVAVNRKSKVSRKAVNDVLQKQLNHNPIVAGSPFRLADKIVNTKNRFYPPVDREQQTGDDVTVSEKGDIYVANGELGKVTRVEPKYMEVSLTGPERMIRVPRGTDEGSEGDPDEATGTGCDWDLAYALSVHKSQGSEWPVVIVVVDEYPGARSICDRAWLYTAISRAKQRCYLVGRKATADRFTRANNISKRKTFLRELIGEYLVKL